MIAKAGDPKPDKALKILLVSLSKHKIAMDRYAK